MNTLCKNNYFVQTNVFHKRKLKENEKANSIIISYLDFNSSIIRQEINKLTHLYS